MTQFLIRTYRMRRILFWLLLTCFLVVIVESGKYDELHPRERPLMMWVVVGFLIGPAIEFANRLSNSLISLLRQSCEENPGRKSLSQIRDQIPFLWLFEFPVIPACLGVIVVVSEEYQFSDVWLTPFTKPFFIHRIADFVKCLGIGVLILTAMLVVYETNRWILRIRSREKQLHWWLVCLITICFYIFGRVLTRSSGLYIRNEFTDLEFVLFYAMPMLFLVPGWILLTNKSRKRRVIFLTLYFSFLCFFTVVHQFDIRLKVRFFEALKWSIEPISILTILFGLGCFSRILYGINVETSVGGENGDTSVPQPLDWRLSRLTYLCLGLLGSLIFAAVLLLSQSGVEYVGLARPTLSNQQDRLLLEELRQTEGISVAINSNILRIEFLPEALPNCVVNWKLWKLSRRHFSSVEFVNRKQMHVIPWNDLPHLIKLETSELRISELSQPNSSIHLTDCELFADSSAWPMYVSISCTESLEQIQKMERNLEVLKGLTTAPGPPNLEIRFGGAVTEKATRLLSEIGIYFRVIYLEAQSGDEIADSLKRLAYVDNATFPFIKIANREQLPRSLWKEQWFAQLVDRSTVLWRPSPHHGWSSHWLAPGSESDALRLGLVSKWDIGIPGVFFNSYFDPKDRKSFKQQLLDSGLANESGTAIFLPQLTPDIAAAIQDLFPNVEYLSFNLSQLRRPGIGRLHQSDLGTRFLGRLDGFKKLKYLAIPPDVFLDDLEFVNRLPNLNVLDAQVNELSVEEKGLPSRVKLQQNGTLPEPLQKVRDAMRAKAGLAPLSSKPGQPKGENDTDDG